ncbi:PRC-barrel domain-containing protein [Methylocapsa acidiphila]|uniref:PRC-barrel domain-containing protein n=1 Tax=Methylocapsa acidiphila TaxID=133552 RepID=UPI00041A663D|nr:PRC-barrel domain-containing protein [Methylocapsa acidiphila]
MATAYPESILISSEEVEGTNIFDPNGNQIGQIDHLMIDKSSGQVRYAVMSFGGFLGLGHSHYPLPWSSLNYDKGLEGYTTNVTESQLKDAPEFSDDSWASRDWESRMHQHYKVEPYWSQSGGMRAGGSGDLSQSGTGVSRSL